MESENIFDALNKHCAKLHRDLSKISDKNCDEFIIKSQQFKDANEYILLLKHDSAGESAAMFMLNSNAMSQETRAAKRTEFISTLNVPLQIKSLDPLLPSLRYSRAQFKSLDFIGNRNTASF